MIIFEYDKPSNCDNGYTWLFHWWKYPCWLSKQKEFGLRLCGIVLRIGACRCDIHTKNHKGR